MLYSVSSNSLIWIVDDKGHVFLSEPDISNSVLSEYKDETTLPKLPDPKQYLDVMNNGGEIFV